MTFIILFYSLILLMFTNPSAMKGDAVAQYSLTTNRSCSCSIWLLLFFRKAALRENLPGGSTAKITGPSESFHVCFFVGVSHKTQIRPSKEMAKIGGKDKMKRRSQDGQISDIDLCQVISGREAGCCDRFPQPGSTWGKAG